MGLNELTVKKASELLVKRKISSLDLVSDCLKRIKEVDDKIKACLTLCEDEALQYAKETDVKIKKGERGQLLGIPFLVKDNIMTKNVRTTAASKILENYIAPYDATIIKRLKEAGAIVLGKTNLDEFAHGASTENSAFGSTHNPWDLDKVPGGSSGGSAAAVAANMCLFALGTDTGASIRYPAGFCGVTGLKPTYGRSSRFGLIAMTSSTDVPGPLTKTAEDAAIILSCIAGPDQRDATTVNEKVDEYEKEIKKDINNFTIGLPKEYFTDELEDYVRQAINSAVQQLEKLGAKFVDINLPHTKYTVPVYYIITPSEISSNLARFDGIRYGLSTNDSEDIIEFYKNNRGAGFGPEAKRRIMLGTFALSSGYYDAYYKKAQQVRTVIKQEFDDALEKVDCILTPTAPHVAFNIGEKANDPLKMYLEDIYMTGASLAGLPAISIPAGFYNNLPIGMQIIGKRFGESTILRVGYNWQLATNFHLQKPNL